MGIHVLNRIFCRILSHCLSRDDAVRNLLVPFTDQTVVIQWDRLLIAFTIAADGSWHAQDPATCTPQATIVCHWPKQQTWPTMDDMANAVHVQGPAALAQTIATVIRHIDWHWADDLERWLGPVVSQRLEWCYQKGRRRLRRCLSYFLHQEATCAYVSFEAELGVNRLECAAFVQDVHHYTHAVDRLSARVDRLKKRIL